MKYGEKLVGDSGLQIFQGRLAAIAKRFDNLELSAFIKEGEERYYEAGEQLIAEGEFSKNVYDFLTGIIALERKGHHNRRQILSFLGPSQFLGTASSVGYRNLATALTDARVVCYSRENFEGVLQTSPEFAAEVRYEQNQLLENAYEHIYLLGKLTAVEKVASFLLSLSKNNLNCPVVEPVGSCVVIDFPMKRTDVADYLGLTIETVSRVFSSLKKSGIISFENRNSCTILDIQRLRELGVPKE